MKLRTATAWAILGYAIAFIINIYYFLFNRIVGTMDYEQRDEVYEKLESFHLCLNIVDIIAIALPLVFFITLYNKQSNK